MNNLSFECGNLERKSLDGKDIEYSITQSWFSSGLWYWCFGLCCPLWAAKFLPVELPGTFPSGGLKVHYNTTWFTFSIIYLLPPIVCKLTVMFFFTVLVIGECSSTRQCRPTECCVKLTGSRHRICLPLLQLGDSCRIVKNPGPIYTDACPCAEGLICRPNILPLTDVDECTPDSNFVRNQQLWFSFQQTIVQALRQKPRTFQHSNGTKKKVPMRRSDDENKTTE